MMRDHNKIRKELREALQNGDLTGIPALLTPIQDSAGEIETTSTVSRMALACLTEEAFSMARGQPILMSKGAQAVHSEREAELEREMEAQAQRYELQLAECRKKSAERDNLALQVDQLQARLKLLSDAADWAVKLSSDATREVLNVISQNGEIPF